MTSQQALVQLLSGMYADRRSYAQLKELLEEQFRGALLIKSELLLTLAQRIGALVETLNAQRLLRRQLVARVLDRSENLSMTALLQHLPESSRKVVAVTWAELEAQVRECKELNSRNCELIVEQQALMQRLMGVEQDTYAEL